VRFRAHFNDPSQKCKETQRTISGPLDACNFSLSPTGTWKMNRLLSPWYCLTSSQPHPAPPISNEDSTSGLPASMRLSMANTEEEAGRALAGATLVGQPTFATLSTGIEQHWGAATAWSQAAWRNGPRAAGVVGPLRELSSSSSLTDKSSLLWASSYPSAKPPASSAFSYPLVPLPPPVEPLVAPFPIASGRMQSLLDESDSPASVHPFSCMWMEGRH
jgi:hypothetical protein